MKNHHHLEKTLEKKYREKDWRKRKRMKVSGKSVLLLQKLLQKNIVKKIRKVQKGTKKKTI